jgi:PKD repeat protein/DNA-binding beta-propeller fold protein YncE
MKGRVSLTVFLLLFICLASTAFAEQVVEVWRYPWAGIDEIAASADDGSVWVAQDAGTVLRLAPGLGGELQEAVRVRGFAAPRAIAANSADGSAWVGDCCFEQVVHLAADGTELSRTGGIGQPLALSVDPTDGSCWVVDRDGHYVVHLGADGTELLRWYVYGVAPAIAAVPGTNSCWIGNCCSDQVIHLQDDLDGTATALSTTGGFANPQYLSADSGDGTLWFTYCSEGGQVIHLQDNLDGSTTVLSTTPLTAPQSLSAVAGAGVWVVERCGDEATEQPYVVHVDAGGEVDVTVTDIREPHQVSADDANGSCWVLGDGDLVHLAAAGDTLQREALITQPRQIAADPRDGSSWVADCSAHRVSHVTADGEVVAFGSELLGAPISVAVDPVDGSIWVGDRCGLEDSHEVIHLAADGTEISRTPGFCCPRSLAVDPNDGSCWVADARRGCLVQISAEGDILFEGCPPDPTAVAVDPNDSSVWLGFTAGSEPTAALAAPPEVIEGDLVVHFAMDPELGPTSLSVTSVPVLPSALTVDTFDSSCLATLGGDGGERDLRGSGAPAALDGGAFTIPVLRITDTPSGPTPTAVEYLGGFWRPMSVSVSPLDRSIWVGDGFEVGHMAADGTVLSRTSGYCCASSVSVDVNDGSCWIIGEDTGDVVDLAVLPEAEFTASADTGVAPFEVSFTDLSTGSPTSWAWAFGDGGTSTEQDPTHTYGLGHYTVSLTVEGAGGSDTETKINYIYAGAIAPTADFSATPTTGHAPLTVTFEDLSTNHPTEWLWSFGDGATSDEQNPTHEYENAGTYTVSLVVSNSQGLDVETKTDYITVQQALAAAFSTDVARGPFTLEVHFTDESVGDATSWLWTFGDGGSATAQNPIHFYGDPGFYTVTLLVWSGGVSASMTKSGCIAVGFKDTPADHWAFMQEIACSEAGIVQGYWDGSYDPDGLVNRSQMATFIARALAGGDENVPSGPATPTFTDVSADQWAYRYIEYCAAHDIVLGYTDGTYHPEDTVNRGQMAVYMARTVASPEGMEDFVPPTTATFSDVTSTNDWLWCYKYVEYLATLEPPVVSGYPDGSYRPELSVTRDQMAVFMQRAFDLPIPGSTP